MAEREESKGVPEEKIEKLKVLYFKKKLEAKVLYYKRMITLTKLHHKYGRRAQEYAEKYLYMFYLCNAGRDQKYSNDEQEKVMIQDRSKKLYNLSKLSSDEWVNQETEYTKML